MMRRSLVYGEAFLFTLVLAAGPVRAGYHPPANQKKVAEAAKKAADIEAKFEEAEALRQAFNLLSTADRDYEGHRAKAQAAVGAAIKELDKQVMKKGTAAQKAETVKEDAVDAATKKAADQAGGGRKKQVNSDEQLAQALKILIRVRAVVAEKKQTAPLKEVDRAIAELGTALKIVHPGEAYFGLEETRTSDPRSR